MKKLKDFNFSGKKVLVRVDFNIPLNKDREIGDDFRIKKTLPTIEYLIKEKAKVILISHLESGIEKLSLEPVSKILGKLLSMEVKFLPDCVGKKTEKEIVKMADGEIVLLENLRFYSGEKTNDEKFARALSKIADFYVNDAFSVCHRPHASIIGIPKILPSAAGFLLEKEIEILSHVLENPLQPLVVIIGGAKIFNKIGIIVNFLKKADHLLLGGKVANAILNAKGICHSCSEILKEKNKEKIAEIEITNPKIHLPLDGIISLPGYQKEYLRKGGIGSIRKEEGIFDIGPETIHIFSEIIKTAKTIFWSGPLGMYEDEFFEKGTKEIAKQIISNYSAFKIAGGGDTVSALNKFGVLDKFDYISTGGGAMLEFLSGKKLPGIEILK